MPESPSALLRKVAGVHEAVLNEVPHERPRYTALGGLLVGTAVMSIVSSFLALRWVIDATPLAAFVAVVWGLMILTLDRWLVTSVNGNRGADRVWIYLPRMLMAVLIGVVIAEPLVLSVFDREIEEKIHTERIDTLAKSESSLRRCNPVAGTAEAAQETDTAACQEYRLALPDPGVEMAALAAYQAQARDLETSLKADTKALAELESEARRECAGESGEGLTGKVGLGPNCHALLSEADQYRRTHDIDTKGRQLSVLRETIRQKQLKLSDVQVRSANRRDAAIETRLAEAKAADNGDGMVARLSALQRLTEENGTVAAATWLLRLLIVLIDVLPALARLLMGNTAYDRIIAYQAEQSIRTQFVVAQNRRSLTLARERLMLERSELEIAIAREQFELDASIDRLLVDSRRASLISRRATELRGEGDRTLAGELAPRPVPATPDDRNHPSLDG
jgi:hypothetical protein